jgi:hypothetical protein
MRGTSLYDIYGLGKRRFVFEFGYELPSQSIEDSDFLIIRANGQEARILGKLEGLDTKGIIIGRVLA